MKLLYTFCAFILTVTVFAQVDPDEVPSFSNQVFKKPTVTGPLYLASSSTPPVVSDTVLNCDNADTIHLSASGAVCKFLWYDQPLGGNLVNTDSLFMAGVLNTDTTYYVSGVCGDTAIQMGLPTHNSNYSPQVRGYWFTAPKDFFITGLRVPTDANSGTQIIEVLKFDSVPPIFPTTTNNFTSLGRYVDNSTNMISTCIAIDSGDYIGIYGNRNDVNSYSGGTHVTTIDGSSVTLLRSGMQTAISTSAMANVWSLTSGSISRVEMFYSVTADTSARVPLNVTAPQSFNDTIHHTICAGDTFMFGGVPLTAAGVYADSLQTSYNCDSIPILDLTVDPCTGIEEVNAIEFNLYPNPANEQLMLQFGVGVNRGDFELQVLDATGRLVDVKSTVVGSGPLRIRLATEHLNSGMYFVNVKGSSGSRIQKFINE